MYQTRRSNAGWNWVVVVLWIAVVIGVVAYFANAPLGFEVIDGLKAVNSGLF